MQSLPTLVSVTTSVDDLAFCTACDTNHTGDRRHCTECLCIYCGGWAPLVAPQTDNESTSLQQCASCATKVEANESNASFGMTRLHKSCYDAARNTAFELLGARCFPAVVCKQCGAVLFPEATPSGSTETKGEIDQRAVVEAKASPDEKTSAVKLEQQELLDDTLQAGIAYDGVPDIMSALMSSDPRAMTFETQHFGALRLALEFMHQDHHLLANSSNVESLDGQSTAAATSSSPRMLQVTASPYYPQAASRLRVKAAQNTKPLQLTLEDITSGRKAAPFSSSSKKDEEFGGIAGARRRQRILAAEVTAKAEASTSTSQRQRNTEHSKLTLDAERLHRHFISVSQQAHNVCSQDVSGTQEQQSRDKGIALGDILRPPFKSALEGLGIVQHSWRTPALVAAAASRKRGRTQGELHSSLSQTKQENTEDKAVVKDEQNNSASHNFVAPSPTSFGSATFWDPESAVGGPFSPNPLPAT